MFKIVRLAVIIMVLVFLPNLSSMAQAEWILNSELSHLTYASTKRTQTAFTGEVNHFEKLTGSVEEDGKAEIIIHMNSVETNSKSRNRRTQKHVFKTFDFPVATVTANLDMSEFADMQVGELRRAEILATLTLTGIEEDIYIVLDVARPKEGRVTAVNQGMIIINADSYNMAEGLDKLTRLAKIRSINPLFPVTFHLVFDQK